MSWTPNLFGTTLPSGFDEFAITGLISNGTTLAFTPDGKLFVLEQAGTIEVYQGIGATEWTQVAPSNNFFTGNPLVVSSSGERGLLGIAFDPNYDSNRYVYVYYTATTPAIHNRISRFTANAAGTQVVAGSESILMDLENLTVVQTYNGGALHFGSDGMLYVAVGNNGNSSHSQSISNRLGKMLRLNPDPANPIPLDNPSSIAGIEGKTTGLNRAIWAAGLRNPYTFAFKSGTNVMYINDVGNITREEVNVGAAGANYGWPTTEGPFNPASYPNFTAPIVYYHHTNEAGSFPPLAGFTGHAITGGAFYTPPGTMFPADYIGGYFFGDYIDGSIWHYNPVSISVQHFASNAGGPVELRIGPDGALYYLARNTGRVLRVHAINPCSADVAPVGGNGIVGVGDLLALINNWGMCSAPCPPCPADVSGDCTVSVGDLLEVINGWGPCPED